MRAYTSQLLKLSAAVTLTLGAGHALADPASPAPVSSPGDASTPLRLRWGAGGDVGYSTFDQVGDLDLPGLYGRIGVQVNDTYGVEIEAAAGTLFLLTGAFRAAVLASLTPFDWLSFGVGPVLGWNYNSLNDLGYGLAGCTGGGNCPTPAPAPPSSASYVAAAARVDFLIGSKRAQSGSRRAFDLGLEGQLDPFLAPVLGATGGALYLTIGFLSY